MFKGMSAKKLAYHKLILKKKNLSKTITSMQTTTRITLVITLQHKIQNGLNNNNKMEVVEMVVLRQVSHALVTK